MKNTAKRSLSLLLALIMVLGLGSFALAADVPATRISVKASADEIYYRAGKAGTATVTATLQPSDSTADVKWTASPTNVVTLSASTGKSITVTAKAAGTVTLTASAGNDLEDSVTIDVIEDEFTSIALDKNSYSVGVSKSVSASVKARYVSGYETVSSGIDWYTDDPDIASVSSSGVIKGVSAGSTTLYAEYNGQTAEASVTVKASVLESVDISSTATVNLNSTTTLTATPTFEGEAGTVTYSWKSDDTTIATVSASGTGKTATITGKKVGSTKITVTAECGGVTVSDSCTVTVKKVTNRNITLYLEDVDESGFVFTSKDVDGDTAYSVISDAIGSYSYMMFGNYEGCGTLYSGSAKVNSTKQYTSTNIRSFCFVPDDEGEYAIEYEAYDLAGNVIASGDLIIVVEGFNSGNITVTLDDEEEYAFTDKTKADKASAIALIEEYLEDNTYWDDDYDYNIVFTAIDDGDCGTLYTDDTAKTAVTKKMTFESNPGTDDYDIADLYFVPEDAGTWEADFTIEFEYKSGSKTKTDEIDGVLQLVVPGDEDDVVTITLDDEDEGYYFDEKTKKEGKSAETLLKNAIAKSYSYIFFTQTSASKKIGTLYTSDKMLTAAEVSSSTPIYYNSSDAGDVNVGDLYFEPKTTGVCEIGFKAYSSAEKLIYTGTLNIVVGAASAEGDIYFTGTTSETIELTEDAFLKWFQEETSSKYKLAYVTFDDCDDYEGTFKFDSKTSSSFEPGEDDYKFYSNTYTSAPSGSKYLKNATYKASKNAEVFTVDFSCYGGTSATSTSTHKTGTLCIFVTKDEVPTINYAITSTSLAFDESDFLSVYKEAMGTTSSTTKFFVQLLGVPEKGTLYYDYTSSTKPGTKLTSSNVSGYDLYINGTSSADSIEDITYIPVTATGVYTIPYMAYSNAGEPLYIGTIAFNYASEKALSCQSSGYTFKALDFYSLTDSDPVMYVTFSQPTTGGLFVNYANGSGTAVTSSVKLYTVYSTYGTYPISALTYIPKAGYSGTVNISYSAYTASGSKFNGTIKMSVTTKTASSTFTDVTAKDVGTWAADAIDFACDWGLVQGTDLTKKLYSPYNTMKRCDMVLILYRAAGSPKVTGTCAYTDVPANAYYYDSALWASQNNIMTGVVTGKSYNPNGAITRQDFATILYNYTKYRGISVTNSGSLTKYTDANSVSAYAKDAVTWAVARGYITSMSTTELILSPTTSANRAQVATLLHRYFTY